MQKVIGRREIDYDETKAPVAKMDTVRTLISCAVNLLWVAFTSARCEECFSSWWLFTRRDPYGHSSRFWNKQTDGKVCRLKKSLYGLKQSPRAWTGSGELFVVWATLSVMEIIQYRHRRIHITILAVYVDDIVITGDDVEEIKCLKARLGEAFEVKDLGPLRYFLRIETVRSKKGVTLSRVNR